MLGIGEMLLGDRTAALRDRAARMLAEGQILAPGDF
jgi:hypothetical protein